jgi:hypothetical protein
MAQTWDTDPTGVLASGERGQASDKERGTLMAKVDTLARGAVRDRAAVHRVMLSVRGSGGGGAQPPSSPVSPATLADTVTDALIDQLLQEALRDIGAGMGV